MARINSNIPSLTAQAQLGRTNQELELRLQRLSTGLRINRGADDPAGLIVSERIRSDIEGVSQGIKNGERASSVIATTEAALAEVNDLLNSIRALIVEAANSGANSSEERDANQLQIDSAIDSITRIANTSSFGGLKLLDGSRDYTLSGVQASAISKAEVRAANFVDGGAIDIEVDVLASAQTGALYLNGDITPIAGQLASSVTLEVRGPDGVTVLSFQSGQTLDSVVLNINKQTALTGVRAELINGNAASGIVLNSVAYGSDAFVSVTRLDKPNPSSADGWSLFRLPEDFEVPDPFDWSAAPIIAAERDAGRDVSALINGQLANGEGLKISINSTALSLELLLNENLATLPNAASTTFSINSGGALFQLGPDITPNQQVNIGVRSVAASRLGGTLINGELEFLTTLKSGQGNSIRESFGRGSFTAASEILETAIDEISIMRGRLGAFERNVLQTNTRSLQAAFENLNASTSRIRDADFAFETSKLTRAQILSQSGTTVLQLANQQSQQALQLLG